MWDGTKFGEIAGGGENSQPEGFKGTDDKGKKSPGTGGSIGQTGKKGKDANKDKNSENKAKSDPIKGKLHLVGHPGLRAKKGITIEGIGERFSGTYYVKQVIHSWDGGKGYLTEVDLAGKPGESGGGGGGKDKEPMVMYSDIYKKNHIYVGPRKSGESQETITFGDGKYSMSYDITYDGQSNRQGGEKGGGGSGGGGGEGGGGVNSRGSVNVRKDGKPVAAGPGSKNSGMVDSSSGTG